MSAISAVWSFRSNELASHLNELVLDGLAMHGVERGIATHRGGVSLGSLQDLHLPEDRFDEQPLWTRDGVSCLVADLRLDNRAELVRELHLTQSDRLADSALLLAAWRRWGEACVDHLLGGFAFVVWSPAEGELFAARDHTGERPLYFYRAPDYFAIASMPKGLLALPGVPLQFNEHRILSYLNLAEYGPRETFFQHIEKLPAGHLLRIQPDHTICRAYWHPSDTPETRYRRPEEYGEELVERLDRATAARMRSSGRVGATLSAGLDSSSVAASAATLLGAQGRRLPAFTSVPRPDYNGSVGPSSMANEGPAAGLVAQLYSNIDHYLIHSGGRRLLDDVRQMTDASDEPVNSVVSQAWLSAIFERARQQGIGVLLNGQMGNATISYDGTLVLRDLYRQGRWPELVGTAVALRRNRECSIKEITRIAFDGWLPGPMLRYLQPYDPHTASQVAILQPEFAARHRVEQRRKSLYFANLNGMRANQRHIFDSIDLGAPNAGFSAFSGVDFRDPTADKRIFEFCYSIPAEVYVSLGRPRSLVRRGMRGRLPEDTLTRHTWGRQTADWNLTVAEAMPALRDELDEMRRSPSASRMIDIPYLERLLDQWPKSDFNRSEIYQTWNYNLCRGIALGYFLRSQESAVRAASGSTLHMPAFQGSAH